MKYILWTKSQSGDSYEYFIETTRPLTLKQIGKFLEENASDKEGKKVYEDIENYICLDNKEFIKI